MTSNKVRVLIPVLAFIAGGLPFAMAEQQAGERDFFLAGSGVSSDDFDTTSFGASFNLGWFTTKAFEWGFRQDVGVASTEETTRFNGATRVFVDYHFDFGVWQPFVGASLGAQYGSGVNDAFIIGPEVGAKYYVMPKTYILGLVSYQFDVEEDVGDGSTFYTLGIGFNF